MKHKVFATHPNPQHEDWITRRPYSLGIYQEAGPVLHCRDRVTTEDTEGDTMQLPRRSAPSSGVGCCEGHWHGHARSSSGRAGSCGTAGIGTGNPSYSRSGSRSTPQDGRLAEGRKWAGGTGEKEVIFIWRNKVNTAENQISQKQAKAKTKLELTILNCLLVNGTCFLLE